MSPSTKAALDRFRAWLEKEKREAEEEMRVGVREALFYKKLDEGEGLEDPDELSAEEVEAHLYDIEGLDIDDDPGVNFTYGYMHALRDVLQYFDTCMTLMTLCEEELDEDATGNEGHRASGPPDVSLIQRGRLIKVIRRWGSEIFVNLFLATGDAMHRPRHALSAAATEVAQHLGIPAAEDVEVGSFDWATFLESATPEQLARHGLRHIDLGIGEEIVVDDCDDPRKLN